MGTGQGRRRQVVMEPELEALAGGLDAAGRWFLADKLTRWARQLRVTARALVVARRGARAPRLRGLPPREAARN